MAAPGCSSARLLDLTRLVSRVGRGAWTGIDRVEAAYLAQLLSDPATLTGLVRLPSGYALLDRDGVAALNARLRGTAPWGRPDLRARRRLMALPEAQAADADLRRLAVAFAPDVGRLETLFATHLPRGFVWINCGHSNLAPDVFDAVHGAGGRAHVLVHDTIPLDFPHFQRPGTVAVFEDRMRAVAAGADLVVCVSETARADAARHFARFGRVPQMLVAHLGISVPTPDNQALPPGFDRARDYFVTVGTIEPRKNHGLLLDVWAHFAKTLPEADIPALHIVGARGWANAALFERLDRAPTAGGHVFEWNALGDRAVAAMVAGARALLMPSLAEGFGLPPGEALALGTPVIVSNLPVYREFLGNNPVYVNGSDMYSWANEILGALPGRGRGQSAARVEVTELPTWQDHFDLIFKVT